MGFLRFSKVYFLLLAAHFGTEVSASSGIDAPSGRVLRAATKRSDVFRRSMRIAPRYNTQVSYIEST